MKDMSTGCVMLEEIRCRKPPWHERERERESDIERTRTRGLAPVHLALLPGQHRRVFEVVDTSIIYQNQTTDCRVCPRFNTTHLSRRDAAQQRANHNFNRYLFTRTYARDCVKQLNESFSYFSSSYDSHSLWYTIPNRIHWKENLQQEIF